MRTERVDELGFHLLRGPQIEGPGRRLVLVDRAAIGAGDAHGVRHDHREDRREVERRAHRPAHLAEGAELVHRPRQLARPRRDRLFEPLLVPAALVDQRPERAAHGVEVARELPDLVAMPGVDRRLEVPRRDQAGRFLQRGQGTRDGAAGDDDRRHGDCRDADGRERQDAGDVPEDLVAQPLARDGEPHGTDLLALVHDIGGLDEERRQPAEVGERQLLSQVRAAPRDHRLPFRQHLHEGQRLTQEQRVGKVRDELRVQVPHRHRQAYLGEPRGVVERVPELGLDPAHVHADADHGEGDEDHGHDGDEGRGEPFADAAGAAGRAFAHGGGVHSRATASIL